MKLVIGALLAITGALFMLPGIASATEVDLDKNVSCLSEDGSWSVTWTATNTDSDLEMTIYVSYILENFDPVSFTPTTVAPGASATAISHFGPGLTSATLIVEASWGDEIDGSGLEADQPTELCSPPDPCLDGDCVITICSNGELVTGTERELANLPRTDDCGEDPCPFNPNIAATDSACAPPPEFGQVCVDTDGDGKGDEFQVFRIGNLPAGAIMSADGDACNPVTLPEEPQVQEVLAVAEVLPVALPAAGSGGTATTTGFAGLAGLALVLLGGSGVVALAARRR